MYVLRKKIQLKSKAILMSIPDYTRPATYELIQLKQEVFNIYTQFKHKSPIKF